VAKVQKMPEKRKRSAEKRRRIIHPGGFHRGEVVPGENQGISEPFGKRTRGGWMDRSASEGQKRIKCTSTVENVGKGGTGKISKGLEYRGQRGSQKCNRVGIQRRRTKGV